MEMKIIARIYTGFPEKFGVPRQSGIAMNKGKIIFEPEYRVKEAVRGLDGYSHIWLLWIFDKAMREEWNPTVRPPRLGGNKRMGVFATRSPFRPNPVGLSCVRLDKIEYDEKYGTVLCVTGADLTDETPIIDIKPYLSFTDSIPDAVCGFSDEVKDYALDVAFADGVLPVIDEETTASLISVLSHDPRPSYQNDENRVYGMDYCGYCVKFKVKDRLLTVIELSEK